MKRLLASGLTITLLSCAAPTTNENTNIEQFVPPGWMKEDKTLKLRPHFAALTEAYRNECERGKGLRDAKTIALFEQYVHNSLAGFDKDETWPSDSRILYVGGDKKLRYATISPDRQAAPAGVAAT